MIYLVGNKADLLNLEDIDRAEIDDHILELMKKYSLPHIFTSAKNNINVKELFVKCTELALDKKIFDESPDNEIRIDSDNKN